MFERIRKICDTIDVTITSKKELWGVMMKIKLTMNSKWSSLAMREMEEP